MSVSDPTNPFMINCTVITLYTKSSFLKATMATQLFFAVVSLVSMGLTVRKISTTVVLDRVFKEFLLCCFLVQFVHSFSLAALQSILLYTHLHNVGCSAFISARLCYGLRMTNAIATTLPYLNVSLNIFRIIMICTNLAKWSEILWIHRIFQLIALLVGISFQLYKFAEVDMSGFVVYCIGNFPGINQKMVNESIAMTFSEFFSIICGGLLYRAYKKSTKSYEVNTSLIRRQTIQTFRLFIALKGRSHSRKRFYITMYYIAFCPGLIYYIIVREERKRVKETNDLLAKENHQEAIFFSIIDYQWNGVKDQTTFTQATEMPRRQVQTIKKRLKAARSSSSVAPEGETTKNTQTTEVHKPAEDKKVRFSVP